MGYESVGLVQACDSVLALGFRNMFRLGESRERAIGCAANVRHELSKLSVSC